MVDTQHRIESLRRPAGRDKEKPSNATQDRGLCKETVNDVIRYAKEDFDGIIQLFPVGCMPEIVAKSVLDNLTKEERLPALSIIYDEMGGEAGYATRIEAFVEMLERKRKTKDVLSGNRCGVCKH